MTGSWEVHSTAEEVASLYASAGFGEGFIPASTAGSQDVVSLISLIGATGGTETAVDYIAGFPPDVRVQVSVLPSDTSASRVLAMGCISRSFRPDSLGLWSVAGPFQPPLVWAAHYWHFRAE